MLLQPRCLHFLIPEVVLNTTRRAVPPKNFPLPQQFECSKRAFLGGKTSQLRGSRTSVRARGSLRVSTRRRPLRRGALGLPVTAIYLQEPRSSCRVIASISCWSCVEYEVRPARARADVAARIRRLVPAGGKTSC